MKNLLFLLLALLLASRVWGDCAPEGLARIVVRNATPGIDRESFAGQPRTLYRLGEKYARIEEAADPENGIHGLVITAAPDSWIINLATKSGRHLVDPSEPYVVRAPVFGGPTDSEALRTFEFGCELAYMTKRRVQPETTTVGRFTVDNYGVTEGDHRIVLSIINGTERPLFAGYFKSGELKRMYQYIQYDLQLTADPRLFVPPNGITIEEATP